MEWGFLYKKMNENIVAYQKPISEKKHLLQYITYYIDSFVAIMSSLLLLFLCAFIFYFSVTSFVPDSWKTNVIIVCVLLIPFTLFVILGINGIVRTFKTGITINTILLENGIVTINYSNWKKSHNLTIKATRINAEITEIGIGIGRGGPKGITIYDYGNIALQQRIRGNDETEIKEMVKVIKTIRAESGYPLPWL